MRKSILWAYLFLCSCAPVPQYYVRNSVAETPESGKTFLVEAPNPTVYSTMMLSYMKDYLKDRGYKIVDNKKNARYGLAFGVEAQDWQTQKTVPVWGRTGINSINTNSYGMANTNMYGTASMYGNTAVLNANSYTNYSGYSNTTVNYDYGVTGFQNVIVNNHIKRFQLIVFDFKKKNVIVQSTITTTDYVDNDTFLSYVKNIYNDISIFTPIQEDLYCELGVCEIPKTLLQRAIE